jgi:hypothetical protein
MRVFPGLDLSPCFSPLVTKPLWTFSFSVYEVWAAAPLPRLGQNKLEIGYVVSPDRPLPTSTCHLSPEVRAGAASGPVGLRAGTL